MTVDGFSLSRERFNRIARAMCRHDSSLVERKQVEGDLRSASWEVVRTSDRRMRPALRISPKEMMWLKAVGAIVEAGGLKGFIWQASFEISKVTEDNDKVCKIPNAVDNLEVETRRLPRSGFARLVMLAKQGKGPFNKRQVDAALCFLRDLEAQGTHAGLVMNWTQIANIREKNRSNSSVSKAYYSSLASYRLRELSKIMSERDYSILHAACVAQLSLTSIESKFGLSKRSAGHMLAEILEKVANAYDFQISGGRY
ncbi:DUF6456 domain-containing protein [Hirschia litorea]|uniref:DUF6456 domain-containing protein n=1 Tax=Hirschia litorea TaxID=1199156 RepID=A0ABW2IIZ8_9PROT